MCVNHESRLSVVPAIERVMLGILLESRLFELHGEIVKFKFSGTLERRATYERSDLALTVTIGYGTRGLSSTLD